MRISFIYLTISERGFKNLAETAKHFINQLSGIRNRQNAIQHFAEFPHIMRGHFLAYSFFSSHQFPLDDC